VTCTSSYMPTGCKVELAALSICHGSRYPGSGSYNGWVNLSRRIQAAGPLSFTDSNLDFLKTWKPALSYPERQTTQISLTGYKELTSIGAKWRLRYPNLYEYNTPFTMWANYFASSPRVRDSARTFAHGFIGLTATQLTTIYTLNASDPAAWGNSLETSNICKAYNDIGGGPAGDAWDKVYLPPISSKMNSQTNCNFSFTASDASTIPYLCGFETQITGWRSPFCDLLTENEVLNYEYAQDLRYWYGTGLGPDTEKYHMLPVLDMVVQRFTDGPNAVDKTRNSTFLPPKIIVSFTNDGQSTN
jgi:acid phosphatase